jgi:hypothetical protein
MLVRPAHVYKVSRRGVRGRRVWGGVGVAARCSVVLSACVALAASAAAQGRAPARGDPGRAEHSALPVVLVLEGSAPEWVRRVRGQLSDLQVSIKTGTASVQGWTEPELDERLRELAAARGAALVAWLSLPTRAGQEGASDGVSVSIWFAESGHSYTRIVARHWSHASSSDRSGALEIGALSVRSAVRSLLLDPASDRDPFAESGEAPPGASAAPSSQAASAAANGAGPTGAAANGASSSSANSSSATTTGAPASAAGAASPSTSSSTGAAQSASPVTSAKSNDSSVASQASGLAHGGSPLPAPAEEEPQLHITLPTVLDRALAPDAAPRPEHASSPLELHWSNELGIVGQLYGEPALGAMAFEAGLHAASGPIRLGVLGELSLPTVSRVGGAQLEVWRYAVLAEGQYAAWQAGAWSVRPLLRAGVALIRRETTTSDSSSFSAREPKLYASPLLAAGAITEYRLSERVGVSLRGLLQTEPLAPAYSVTDSKNVPLIRTTQWPIQPMMMLAANWYW